jgi:hypothetical protein
MVSLIFGHKFFGRLPKTQKTSLPKKMASTSSTDDGYTENFQVGIMAAPAMILSVGNPQFDTVDKKLSDCKMLITDSTTIQVIHELEVKIQTKYPGMVLDSCFGEELKNPDDGTAAYPLRVKMTKLERCYRVKDAWQTGAAPNLSLLDYGHTVVVKCRAREWTYQDKCGITIYVNLLRGIGAVPHPWGLQPKADSVEWQ